MNLRVTIGFLAALVVVGAIVFGLERFGPAASSGAGATGAAATPDPELAVFSFDDRAVRNFTARVGDKTVRVQRDVDGNWTLPETGEAANRASFSSLLVRMSQLRGSRRVGAESDLAAFGLAEPKASVIAQLEDGTTYQLDMGDRTPVQSGTYAKKADAVDVYVVATQLQSDLERLVNDPRESPTPTPKP